MYLQGTADRLRPAKLKTPSQGATAFAGNRCQNSAFAALQNCDGGNNDAFGGCATGPLGTVRTSPPFGRDARRSSQTAYRNAGPGIVSLYGVTTVQYNAVVGNRTGRNIATVSYDTLADAWIGGLPSDRQRTAVIATGEPVGTAHCSCSPESVNVLFGTANGDTVNKLQVIGSGKGSSYVVRQTVKSSGSSDLVGQAGEIPAGGNSIYFNTTAGRKNAPSASFYPWILIPFTNF